ncbi:MAG: HAD-IIB family hydrolase [Methylococcales bacterium]|nr:HAD-IIB family hydrolase [Methylococcales bacterium]
MIDRLLICTDLDRTLLPNGSQPESKNARSFFKNLVARPEITLAYVSGRHRSLVEQAILEYQLPLPDFVVGDVGTTIYQVGLEQKWELQTSWELEIAKDWGGKNHADLMSLLADFQQLRLQEPTKQNNYKLSYYTSLKIEQKQMLEEINEQLLDAGIRASLVWSIDEEAEVGLLDVLPERATKFHAVEALMKQGGFELDNTVFSGDSGNDIEVLTSAIPGVLVANSQPEIQTLARKLAHINNQDNQLYLAQGGFMGMNGHYAGGILEGIAHYYPQITNWIELDQIKDDHL